MKMCIMSEMTMDGKITFGEFVSSKRFFDKLEQDDLDYIYSQRTQAEAIIVGRNTINIDNPYLTDRYGGNTKLLRVIVSNTLKFNYAANVFVDDFPTLIVTSEKNKNCNEIEQIIALGKQVIFLGENDVDMKLLRNYLQTNLGMKTVIVEGGGTLNWRMLEANVIDEIKIMLFPFVVGGKNNTSLVDGEGFSYENISNFILEKVEKRNGFLSLLYTREVNNCEKNTSY